MGDRIFSIRSSEGCATNRRLRDERLLLLRCMYVIHDVVMYVLVEDGLAACIVLLVKADAVVRCTASREVSLTRLLNRVRTKTGYHELMLIAEFLCSFGYC